MQVECFGETALDLLGMGDINQMRPCLDLCRDAVERRLRTPGQDDVCAGRRQSPRQSGANPAAGAEDDMNR